MQDVRHVRRVRRFNYEKAYFMLACLVALVVIGCHMAVSIAVIMGW